MNKTAAKVSFGLMVLICLSASADESKPPQVSATVTALTGNAPALEDKVNVKINEGDWNAVKLFVSRQKGRVVVVDIWSTACLPCMREFPNLVKLQQRHGKKIVCVSLNVDYVGIKSKPPSYYQPRVEKFLKGQHATIHNFMCSTDAIELFDELQLNSIPAVFVFGVDGKLKKRFDDTLLEDGDDDAFTYEDDVNPLIETLIE